MRGIFVAYLILEALLAYLYVASFGFGSLVLEVIITGVIGLAFIFKAGLNFSLQANTLRAFMGGEIFSSLGKGFGGFLLFIPGLLTDTLGVIVIIASLIFKQEAKKAENFTQFNTNFNTGNFTQNTTQNDGEIIDVEVIEEEKQIR